MGRANARVGLLGGTFDPPHLGHATVAADVADALDLHRILWIPAAVPPHKQGRSITSGAVRLEMVEAACSADLRFEASAVELNHGGVSYTVDTLRRLRLQSPDAEFVLILGVDQFRTMDTDWKEPEEVLRLATLAVMDRDGVSAPEAVPNLAAADQATWIPVTRLDTSSTEIRRAVAAGVDVAGLISAGVMAIIERERLYRS